MILWNFNRDSTPIQIITTKNFETLYDVSNNDLQSPNSQKTPFDNLIFNWNN